MSEDVIDLAWIIAIWIFVMVFGMRDRKGDSAKLLLAKRIMRHTFTATLVLVVLMAGWALYYVKVMK